MTDIIYGSLNKVAWAIGVPLERLRVIAGDPDEFYDPFPKQKPNGKVRIIDRPIGELKDILGRLNTVMLRDIPLPACMIGGVRGRDPLDHPRYHIGKKVVVTIDVKDCFPSITNGRIFRVYREVVKCSPEVANLLTKLTTWKGHLPLGSSTSTSLANLVLTPVVLEIEKLATKEGFQPSQFVDDTALSGEELSNSLITEVIKIYSRHNLQIGRKKIKVMRAGSTQVVTGKMVNIQAGIPFERRKKVRAALYQLSKMLPTDPGYLKLYRSVRGRVAEIERLHANEGQRLMSGLAVLANPQNA